MATYKVKPIEHYIEKHGEEKGTMIWERETKKAKKYCESPYQRMTKEWFIWRYGEDEGVAKFQNHVNKSRHTLENFIRKHGNHEGKKIYEDTIRKKDTVSIVREKKGAEAVNEWYKKASETRDNTFIEMSEKEINEHYTSRSKRYKKTFKDKYGDSPSRLDIFIKNYGEDEGIQKYISYMTSIFSGPNRMSLEAYAIYEKLKTLLDNSIINELYCDIGNTKEYWLHNKETGKFFSYDFTCIVTKSILEYDGIFWHPIEPSEDIHPVTKKPLSEMFEYDLEKKALAESKGFKVFKIRSDMDEKTKNNVLEQFTNRLIQKRNK